MQFMVIMEVNHAIHLVGHQQPDQQIRVNVLNMFTRAGQ